MHWKNTNFLALLSDIAEEEQQATQKCSQDNNPNESANTPVPTATSLEELIINSVRTKPPLWDTDCAKKFPSQTLELWEQVCTEVGQPISKRDVIKSTWSSLRNKFMKARNVVKQYKPSGAAAKKRKTSGFVFYEEMLFLADSVDIPK